MGSEKLEEFKDDFALFVEAGFIAVKQLDEGSAAKIFRAAQALQPDSVAPRIGMGYIALNKLEMKEATAIFLEVTTKEPENYLARTFLGMCYLLTPAKRKEGEELIMGLLDKTTDPTVLQLAKLSLEWVEKDLKKSKSPFFAKQT